MFIKDEMSYPMFLWTMMIWFVEVSMKLANLLSSQDRYISLLEHLHKHTVKQTHGQQPVIHSVQQTLGHPNTLKRLEPSL